MQIQIDQQTISWLQKKGRPVSIKALQVNACCAPPIQDVMTYLRKPKDPHNYTEMNIHNITLFIERPLSGHETITLKLSSIGIFKMISAKIT